MRAVAESETAPNVHDNPRARWANVIGVVGALMSLGVLALGVSAIITALTTSHYMLDGSTDDPFYGTGLTSAIPLILGFIGLIFGILGVAGVRAFGERRVAIRGLVLNILTVLLSIGVIVVMYNFDNLYSTCGGG